MAFILKLNISVSIGSSCAEWFYFRQTRKILREILYYRSKYLISKTQNDSYQNMCILYLVAKPIQENNTKDRKHDSSTRVQPKKQQCVQLFSEILILRFCDLSLHFPRNNFIEFLKSTL